MGPVTILTSMEHAVKFISSMYILSMYGYSCLLINLKLNLFSNPLKYIMRNKLVFK